MKITLTLAALTALVMPAFSQTSTGRAAPSIRRALRWR